ncbi:MAG: MliC family protein [Sphingopyxis sp.]|uniref:MliC family protein n=1 Tax=Sphingopyxis sp. TaxID=1908224 RepID=UPI002ABBF3D1|nr:MliC family protein [Sphingopyxis sp.]MDZ3831787.1 MliC family protein [Sphingopyxis sp.]
MTRMMTIVAGGAVMLAMAACSSVPARTGSFYECNGGTKLNVNYVKDGALVRVNGGRTLALRAVPSNSGSSYENKTGARLHRDGNMVSWNTAARTAAESCKVIMTPF